MLVVVVLYVVSTYLSFMNYRENLVQNGTWSVSFQTTLQPDTATLKVKDASLQVSYVRHAEHPNYVDWLSSQFERSTPSSRQDDITTVYTVHVTIEAIAKEKVRTVLFDESYGITLDDMTSGVPLTLNKTFGPYIAYNSSLPLKVQYVIEIVDYSGVVQTSTGSRYVTAWQE